MAELASILVTGASGMIGLYLTSSLLHKKHRVFGIDTRKNEFIGTDPNVLTVHILSTISITDSKELYGTC